MAASTPTIAQYQRPGRTRASITVFSCRVTTILATTSPPDGQVVYPRLRPQLLLVPERLLRGEDGGETEALVAVGHEVLVRVPEVDGQHGAALHAGGEATVLQAVGAEHALLDDTPAVLKVAMDRVRGQRLGGFRGDGRLPVEHAHVVRARRHAVSAPDAPILVDQDEAVLGPEGRIDGAHLHARRVLAVHARARQEERAARGRQGEHLQPVLSLRDVVLLAAGNLAPLAPVAPPKVDQHRPPAPTGWRRRGRLRRLCEDERDAPRGGDCDACEPGPPEELSARHLERFPFARISHPTPSGPFRASPRPMSSGTRSTDSRDPCTPAVPFARRQEGRRCPRGTRGPRSRRRGPASAPRAPRTGT